MTIPLKKIPLMVLNEVLGKLIETPPNLMVYWRGKVLSTTKPSKFMTY